MGGGASTLVRAAKMYLPVRIAASVPVFLVFVVVLAGALLTHEGRKLHPVYGFPNGLLIAFLAAAAGLLVVIPNVAAAVAANRIAAGTFLTFALIFTGVFLAGMFAEAKFLDKLFNIRGSLADFRDWKFIAVLAANCATLLALAAFYGRRFHA